MSKRFTVGLELPASIRQTLAELDPGIPGVHWLPQEEIHLTMSSPGNVSHRDEDRLRQALSEVRGSPFFLPVQGLGVFGGEHPSTIWAGVGKGHPHLFALHKHVQDALLHVGLNADLRPFIPNVVMARVEGLEKKALSKFLRQHEDQEFGLWKVTGFALFSSLPSPTGLEYTVEDRWAF